MTGSDERKGEARSYVWGGGLSLLLTLAGFALVALDLLSGGAALVALAALAAAQIVVQFRFFLHIDLKRSHRDDLHLVVFTALILLFMVGGTIWILWSQHGRM